MNPYYIYTPPEIIAREVKKEFSRPAKGYGTVESKGLKRKFLFIEVAALTSPIWAALMFLLLCKTWFGL